MSNEEAIDGPRKLIKFTTRAGPYSPGEIIDVIPDAAKRLTDAGLAVYAELPPEIKFPKAKRKVSDG